MEKKWLKKVFSKNVNEVRKGKSRIPFSVKNEKGEFVYREKSGCGAMDGIYYGSSECWRFSRERIR